MARRYGHGIEVWCGRGMEVWCGRGIYRCIVTGYGISLSDSVAMVTV